MNVQVERTKQTLENMPTDSIIDFGGSWVDHLPLIAFTYNNSSYLSI